MEKKLKVFDRAKVFKHHKSLVLSRSLSHTFREIPRARICVCVSFGRIKKCGGVSCLLVKSESVRVAMHSKRGAGYKAKMKFETLRKLRMESESSRKYCAADAKQKEIGN